MIRIVFLSVSALLAGALILWLLNHDSGYVLIAAGSKTLEMRLSFAVLACVVLFFIIRFLVRHYFILRNKLKLGWDSAKGSMPKRAQAKTQSGLIHYVEGNWLAAKKDLLKAAKGSDQPLINYLAAARSAHELGDSETARSLIQEAEKNCANSELAISLSQARLQMQDQQYELALATLHRTKTFAPNHPVVLELLAKAYLNLKDWRALELLLPELVKNKVATAQYLNDLQRQTLEGLFKDLLKKAEDGEVDQPLDQAKALWKRLSKDQKKVAEFVELYARILCVSSEQTMAEIVLREYLREQPNAALLELYAGLDQVDQHEQLQHLQNWSRLHPESAKLFWALGCVSVNLELWGQANDYFEQSLKIKATPQAYSELAKLNSRLEKYKESSEYFYRAYQLSQSKGSA